MINVALEAPGAGEGRVAHFWENRARAHKTFDWLQSAIGVLKIEAPISRAPYIAGKREASDVLLPRQSPWEHGGGSEGSERPNRAVASA